jgi:hypothetical protein
MKGGNLAYQGETTERQGKKTFTEREFYEGVFKDGKLHGHESECMPPALSMKMQR